jgi:hypothetical protein
MTMNFNDAPTQQTSNLIPEGTICPMHVKIRPGGQGDGGWLKLSKAGDKHMLDVELTVTEGPFARRKVWELMTVTATGAADEGTGKAMEITRARVRAIIEGHHGIDPKDQTDAAKTRRQIKNYGDLDGFNILVKIGIEKGKDGYQDKNKVREVILVGHKDWGKPTQAGAAPSGGAPAAKPASNKPAWAQ